MSNRKQRMALPCKTAPDSILTRDKFAAAIGCHPQTVENKLRKCSRFPRPTRIGGLRIWTADDVPIARVVLQQKSTEPASLTKLLG